jgi:hypothetical protein
VSGLALSIGLLLAAGVVGEVIGLPPIARMILAVPGAIVLATGSGIPDPEWVRVFVAGTTVVGAALIESLDRRCDQLGLGPLLMAVSMVGLYETVPDPDFALLLVGAALPITLLSWPVPLARLGSPGAAAAAGFLAWADAVGGRGRLGTVVAGGACLGLFAIEPLAHLLLRGRPTVIERLAPRRSTPILIVLVQLGIAAACTRIASGGRSPIGAAEIASISLVFAVIATFALSERRSFNPAAAADG